MNTQSKIILVLFSILIGFVLLFGVFIFYSISQYAYEDFNERLQIRAVTAAKIELDYHQDRSYLKNFKEEYLQKLSEEKDYIFKLDTIKTLNSITSKLNVSESFLKETISQKVSYFNKDGKLFFAGILYNSKGSDYLVIVSAQNYYTLHHNTYLKQLLIGASLLAVFIISFVAYWFSAKISRPLNEITKRVSQIGTDNLNLRIRETTNSLEINTLAVAFNSMLDRLETAFETQNNFVSNASHELKTPLTSIICESELALYKERTKEEYKSAIENILSEAEELNGKLKALLFLAQTGFSSKNTNLDVINIDELIFDAKSTLTKIFPNNKIKIDFLNFPENPEQMQIKGNYQLLLLSISNIISNGIKYSNNQEVNVFVKFDDKNVEIEIVDKGIGIPESDMPFVFDTFYRASNTSDFEGYGIGLALSKNIIKIHKGDLFLTNQKPTGIKAHIRIPLDLS
jgi:signal transduction histidine kinase